jgi:ABC-2 type transport system ATP-binding protein
MSVEVKSVTRLFGKQKALDNVSFRVGQGEIVALLGPNGAGKSTMMKIITCYIPQNAGQVKVCGYNVIEQPLLVKRSVGYLPEHNPLYHDMYVKEYLAFVAGLFRLGKKTKSRVDKMIEITGLGPEYKKKIGELSKGYRQRVGLAQALIHDPEVLILDEPTSGLDPNQLAEIRSLIRNIGKEKTILLSTHIMQEVEAICDRVIIIHKGKTVADSPTSEIQLLTKADQIVRVSFDRAIDLGSMRKLAGIADVVEEKGGYYRVFGKDAADVRPAIFHYAVANGFVILSMELEVQSLEQVFRQLTI